MDHDFRANAPFAGANSRHNTKRFFHVMGEGWYVTTREGHKGPYTDKEHAIHCIEILVGKRELEPDDPNDLWRMK